MERRELKRFDDTPTPGLRQLEDKALRGNVIQLQLRDNIYNIYNIIRLRRQSPQTTTMMRFREPLYSNFKTVMRRVHPKHTVVSLIEAFFEAYIDAFGKYANAKVTLFEPLSTRTGVESIIDRAEEGEFVEGLKVCFKVLDRNPEDWETRRKLRRLIIAHRELLSSTRNQEILALLKKAEAYL